MVIFVWVTAYMEFQTKETSPHTRWNVNHLKNKKEGGWSAPVSTGDTVPARGSFVDSNGSEILGIPSVGWKRKLSPQ